jgi:hypothetical protein
MGETCSHDEPDLDTLRTLLAGYPEGAAVENSHGLSAAAALLWLLLDLACDKMHVPRRYLLTAYPEGASANDKRRSATAAFGFSSNHAPKNSAPWLARGATYRSNNKSKDSKLPVVSLAS